MRIASLALAAVVTLASCSGDNAAAPTTSPATVPPTTTTTSVSTAPPDQPTSTDAPSLEPVIPGVARLELLTSGDGLGARPLLQWAAVDGAAFYTVSVNTPDGDPWWVWTGTSTEVPVGGGPADDPDTTGARLTRPLTWFVVAEAADGEVLAASAMGELAP